MGLLLTQELHRPLSVTTIPPSIPWGWLMENNSEYSLEGLLLKLKLQYSGHLMRRADSMEKTLMLGKTESRRRGWQRMRWLDSRDMSLSQLWGLVMDRKVCAAALCAAVHGVAKSQTRLSE